MLDLVLAAMIYAIQCNSAILPSLILYHLYSSSCVRTSPQQECDLNILLSYCYMYRHVSILGAFSVGSGYSAKVGESLGFLPWYWRGAHHVEALGATRFATL